MEDSSPVHMHVTDGSSRFNSAASQTQRIPVSPFGFGRAKERINEAIEQSWTRILLGRPLPCPDRAWPRPYCVDRRIRDRLGNSPEAIAGRNPRNEHNPDEQRFLREKKPCVFRFLSRKNRGSKAGKKGKMACILFHISGKRKITEQNSDFFRSGLRPQSLNCPDTA